MVDNFYSDLEAKVPVPVPKLSKTSKPTIFDSCSEDQLDAIEAQLAETNDTTSLFAKDFRNYIIKAIMAALDSDGSTLEARIKRAGESMRVASRFHKTILRSGCSDAWDKFLKVLIKKCIEMMTKEGLTEGYITFKIFHPEMVTREIQPHFNFNGKAYSDDRWVEIVTSDFWKPYVRDIYFMSGFNRFWRTDIGEYLGEYQWSYFLESSLEAWLESEETDADDWFSLGQSYCMFAKKYNLKTSCWSNPWSRIILPNLDTHWEGSSREERYFMDTIRDYLTDCWCSDGYPFKQKNRVSIPVGYVVNYIVDLCNGKARVDLSDMKVGQFYGINYILNSGDKNSCVLRLVEIEEEDDWSTHIVGYVVGETGISRFNFNDIETIYESC